MKLTEFPAPDFDLTMTLDSGQVFHWEKVDNGFVGVIGDRAFCVEQRGEMLRALLEGGALATPGKRHANGAGSQELAPPVMQLVTDYFALDHPLAEICASFPDDPVMNASRIYCRGLRILRQPKWECLATFICSSMKQVAHIRQISHALRKRFGGAHKIKLPRSIENADDGPAAPRAMATDSASPTFTNIEQGTARSTNNRSVFTFPTAERIAASSEDELRECALGYRAKNFLATAQLVSSGEANLEAW